MTTSAADVICLDSSAIVKLIVDEPESAALRDFVRHRAVASSELAIVEVTRALARSEAPVNRAVAQEAAGRVFASLWLLPLDESVLAMAAALEPPTLRTLDAIHIASALVLANALESLITYDARMQDAARLAGISVAAPA